jgi:hypothetical protein
MGRNNTEIGVLTAVTVNSTVFCVAQQKPSDVSEECIASILGVKE